VSRIAVHRFDKGQNIPMTCFQCEDAACVKVCKTGALSRNAEGVVQVDREKCIGCRMCVMACPFGNIVYHRPNKSVLKCDQCEGDPQCVAFCPTKAIEYLPAETVNLQRKRNFAAKMAAALGEVTE
jgi:Fe-S-cluster-containing hydrogenase component 2